MNHLATKLTLLACLLALTASWWDKGHMLVAQIAYNRLTDAQQFRARDKFNSLVQAFNTLTDGRTNTFAQAAVWPDDIKGYGADMFDNYHFTNIPYDPDYTFSGMNELQLDINSFKTINWCKKVLNTNKQQITFERAFMARYLLHVVGDIHQPLHNTNLFNQTYPYGDLGGNKINVTAPNGKLIKLHNYFDSIALYQNPDASIKRPLNASETNKLQNEARQIARDYSYDSIQDAASILDSHAWAVQTYQIAVNHIYKHTAKTNTLSEQYQQKTRKILFRQIALAGYRLANTIVSIYQD